MNHLKFSLSSFPKEVRTLAVSNRDLWKKDGELLNVHLITEFLADEFLVWRSDFMPEIYLKQVQLLIGEKVNYYFLDYQQYFGTQFHLSPYRNCVSSELEQLISNSSRRRGILTFPILGDALPSTNVIHFLTRDNILRINIYSRSIGCDEYLIKDTTVFIFFANLIAHLCRCTHIKYCHLIGSLFRTDELETILPDSFTIKSKFEDDLASIRWIAEDSIRSIFKSSTIITPKDYFSFMCNYLQEQR